MQKLHPNLILTSKYISLMSDDLETDRQEFEGQMTAEMYRELLERSYEKIAGLKLSLVAAQGQNITLRDEIAKVMFSTAMIDATSLEDAAVDAYRAADALMRVRETGHAFDSDLIGVLKEMRDSNSDDMTFGRSVRTFLKHK